MTRIAFRLSVLVVAIAGACAGCDRAAAPASTATTPPASAPVSTPPEAPAPAPSGPASPHFAQLDTNGDGHVTAAEHEAAAAAMFKTMDSDADGTVTVAEMDAAQPALDGDSRMGSLEKIRTIDRNQDDALTAEEHAIGAQSMFAMMDTDGNGELTPAEVDAGMAQAMGKAAKEPPRAGE